ncbi:CAC1H protein, partial [Atractosteus spatula]|nr:CAC1H protein [Atractosteus spatula]
MTDGEENEHFRQLGSEEVRVPISASEQCPARGADPVYEEDGGSSGNPVMESLGSRGSSGRDQVPDLVSEDEPQMPYPALAPVVFFCLKQTTRPRSWCLRLVCNPYPFRYALSSSQALNFSAVVLSAVEFSCLAGSLVLFTQPLRAFLFLFFLGICSESPSCCPVKYMHSFHPFCIYLRKPAL